MCWSINKKDFNLCEKNFHKVAEKDIEVFKFGFMRDGNFLPLFRSLYFHYEANKRNDEIILVLRNGVYHYFCYEGYHSFSGECICENLDDSSCGLEKSIRSKIYWDAVDDVPFFDWNATDEGNYAIGKFIIPAGTEYYENDVGEFVSSNLIWNGQSCLIESIMDKNFKLNDICVG